MLHRVFLAVLLLSSIGARAEDYTQARCGDQVISIPLKGAEVTLSLSPAKGVTYWTATMRLFSVNGKTLDFRAAMVDGNGKPMQIRFLIDSPEGLSSNYAFFWGKSGYESGVCSWE